MMKEQETLYPFENRDKTPTPPVSAFVKYSALMSLLILTVSLVLTLVFVRREREILFRQKVDSGRVVLNHFASKAALPLLEEDVIALNVLVKQAKEIDGLLYAMILDSKQVIKAHTDTAKIGAPLKEEEDPGGLGKDHPVDTVTARLPTGTEALILSKPILFMNRQVGTVSLGLSLDVINRDIRKETLTLVKHASVAVFILLGAGVGGAFFISKRRVPSRTPVRVPPSETVRNQVAVLYAGIREFKTFSDPRSPEEVFQDLSEYISIATKCVLDHEGYIIKIAGDAVVAVFRSFPLQADHSYRAVRAAVDIQNALALEKGRRSANPLLDKVGIGISSGVVLYGSIGSHSGKEDNYVGESFKVASSLYATAGPGEIVISKDVYQSIEPLVSVDPLPPRERTQRTEAWESFRLRNVSEREPRV